MNKLFFLFTISISFLISYLSDSSALIFILCLLLLIYLVFYKQNDIYSPILWFSPFILIYHFSAVFSYYAGLITIKNPLDVVKATSYAFHSFLFFSVIFIKTKRIIEFRKIYLFSISREKLFKNIVLVLFFTSLFFTLHFISSGISTKSEAASLGVSGGIGDYVNRVLIIFLSIFFFKEETKGKSYFKYMIFFLLYFLSLIFIIGERDFLFIYMIQIILIKAFFKKISFKQIILFITIGLVLIPMLGEMKNVFSRDAINKNNNLNIIERTFYTGEFISGGRNLDTVISYEYMIKESFTYLNDIIRSLIPSNIYYTKNTVSLFAETFHYERFNEGQGLGFSLIAEGFINGGNAGVIILFAFIAIIMACFYNNSNNNIFYFIAYLYFIPLAIYALRGDLSTILSPMIKQVIIPLFIINKLFYVKKQIVSNMRAKIL